MHNRFPQSAANAIPVLFLAAFLIAAATSCSTPAGNPADGERWYSMHNCFACHGPNGDDGEAPDIANLEMSHYRFKGKIRDAGSPIMPKYPEEKISDQDVADLYAFLTQK